MINQAAVTTDDIPIDYHAIEGVNRPVQSNGAANPKIINIEQYKPDKEGL